MLVAAGGTRDLVAHAGAGGITLAGQGDFRLADGGTPSGAAGPRSLYATGSIAFATDGALTVAAAAEAAAPGATLALTGASTTTPYLAGLQLAASDPSTGAFVLLMRSQTNVSGLRKLFFGVAPTSCKPVAPTFMPTTPPFGLWWTGSEFRALLTDGHVWSSATGETWTDQGASSGGPTPGSGVSSAYVVKIGSGLALRFENTVYHCTDLLGLTWSAATGDIATLPTGTYADFFALVGIASNGTRGVICARGKKAGEADTWGLVYTNTTGTSWTKVLEEKVSVPYTYHDPKLNGAVQAFGPDFISTHWPIVPGSNDLSVLTAYSFGGGVDLLYANPEATYGKAGTGVLGLHRYGLNLPYYTTDLADSVMVDWSE